MDKDVCEVRSQNEFLRPPNLLTTREAAELLNLKESTLEQWRWRGCGPLFIKLGRSVRYRLVDVERFTSDHSFTSTTTAQAQVPL